MGFREWFGDNWFAFFVSGASLAGLYFSGTAVWLDARARRVANLIRLTEQHRELWERMYTQSDLVRILDTGANIEKVPVSPEEEMFVVFVILHLSSFYYAMRAGFFQKPHGLRRDIKQFFSLPIPRFVWEKVRALQDRPFVVFVESSF